MSLIVKTSTVAHHCFHLLLGNSNFKQVCTSEDFGGERPKVCSCHSPTLDKNIYNENMAHPGCCLKPSDTGENLMSFEFNILVDNNIFN